MASECPYAVSNHGCLALAFTPEGRCLCGRGVLVDHTASTIPEGGLLPPPGPSVSAYGDGIEDDAAQAAPAFVAQDGSAAGRILDAAKIAVTTDRSKTHGDKERSFEFIAALWSLYIRNRPYPGVECSETWPLSAADVAIMMVLLKIARATQGTPVEDHFVDMAGYAAVAGELR